MSRNETHKRAGESEGARWSAKTNIVVTPPLVPLSLTLFLNERKNSNDYHRNKHDVCFEKKERERAEKKQREPVPVPSYYTAHTSTGA